MRRVLPAPTADGQAEDLTEEELRACYAFPAERPWVRANMVSTFDGVMRGRDGRSTSISSSADRRVFAVARLAADVVLVGAGTLRAEDYRPSRRPIAIVSARLDLPLSLRLFAERDVDTPRPIVFTTVRSAATAPDALSRLADVVPCGVEHVDLAGAVGELNDRGLGRILCEGGPSLLSALAADGLLDELLLTVSPVLLGGGPAEHILDVRGGLDPALRLHPVEVLEEDGSVFLRARRG